MAVRAHVRMRPSPPLRVVKGGGRRPSLRVPVVVLSVLTVFGVTALHAVMGQDGLRASALERQIAVRTEERALLRAQVAELTSPARVAEAAAKAGLVPAPPPVYLDVEAPSGPR